VHEPAHCSVAEFVQANDKGEYALPFYDGLPPKFKGTDDEWLRRLRNTGSHAGPGCPSRKTSGVVGWDAAKLSEAEAMPDSELKREVVKEFRQFLDDSRSRNPEAARKPLMKSAK
jgi:hypothetical protein